MSEAKATGRRPHGAGPLCLRLFGLFGMFGLFDFLEEPANGRDPYDALLLGWPPLR